MQRNIKKTYIRTNVIQNIHHRYPTFGYRFIQEVNNRETGWLVSGKRVLSVIQDTKIQSVVRKKRSHPGKEHETYPNLLNRDFQVKQSLSKIVTDITHLPFRGKTAYLSVFLDLYNHEILDYEIGLKNNLPIIMKPLRWIVSKYKKDVHQNPFTIHSDQGNQYTSLPYARLCQSYNISMSRAGTPLDNASCESFFGWFKDELYKMYSFDDFEMLRKAVHNHNSQLNYFTPIEFHECQITS